MKTPLFWRSNNLVSTLLLPFSALYALGFAWDKKLKAPQRAPLPVISVGNVTAGGAGKTPTAIAIARLLQQIGEVPHIISRGYGGRITTTHRVSQSDDAAEVGDEALLLAKAAPTWIGRDRLASARAAHQAGATLIIADDALQHHALAHDLSILVVDLANGLGNERLLPAGPLRQPLESAYGHAPTLAIAIGEDDPHHLLPRLQTLGEVLRARVVPVGDVSWLGEKRWLAFAGIAHPQKFYATLRAHGAEVIATHDFADHHRFSARELRALAETAQRTGAGLITTEKDAARIPAAWGLEIATLPVALQIEETARLQEVLQLVRRHT